MGGGRRGYVREGGKKRILELERTKASDCRGGESTECWSF